MGKAWQMGWKTCTCSESVASHEPDELAAFSVMLAQSGIPSRFHDAAIHSVSDLGSHGSRIDPNILITGPRGCGKTHMACGILGNSMRMGTRCMFAVSADVFGNLRDSKDDGTIGKMRRVPLLCIDDLGQERPTPWALEALYSVVNARYNAELPTIVTSQYDMGGLGRRLASEGDKEKALAIASRLSEGVNVIRLTGPDRRLSC
jgi:DNA replication protein DnaC